MNAAETIEERMERVKVAALAAGVKFVPESELRALAIRRFDSRNCREKRKAESGKRKVEVALGSCPPEVEREYKLPNEETLKYEMLKGVSTGLDQHGFQAIGKADTANDRLRKFLEHAIKTGQMRTPFSRKFLKELCGNDYINNRIDDMRGIFAPRGIKIENIEYSPSEAVPKSSHYWLVLMSDAEFEEFTRTGKPPC